MPSDESVSDWLGQLKGGDHAGAQKLWEAYFQRLVEWTRTRLQGHPRQAADEEDVALSAFASFCRGVARGRFPQLQDRDSLWRVLLTITSRKVQHLVRDQHRQRRGCGKVFGESALPWTWDADAPRGLGSVWKLSACTPIVAHVQ